MASTTAGSTASSFSFVKLPSELQSRILARLSFDEISRCRLVCKSVDITCQQLLNGGFHHVERFHARCLQRVKSLLPRRESERRTHELARHADILTSIETRLSLLSMTYGKYMDNALCCFIPGKVLDEVFRVLRIVNNLPKGDQAPRPHELLQELRDISSMAMEHFEEHIVPLLRDRINLPPATSNNLAASSLSTNALVLYAAAAGSSSLLNSLSTSSITGLSLGHRAESNVRLVHGARTYKRRKAMEAISIQNESAKITQEERQRYETLKNQYEQQQKELATSRREICSLRIKQQRQKDKITELERRLNEHEQRFVDVLAQLRNSNGLITANNATSSTVVEDSEETNVPLVPVLGKRKGKNLNKEHSVGQKSMMTRKRQKTDKNDA